jgi:AraC-like DNA-binding protein
MIKLVKMINKSQKSMAYEKISPDVGSSFHLMVNPRLNDFYFWHFHPEIELVFIDKASGTRHVGEHVSRYEQSDLVMIGSYIPHLNFDYGVKTDYEKTVLHIQKDFMSGAMDQTPELFRIKDLFKLAEHGIVFGDATKKLIGQRLKQLHQLSRFDQFLEIMRILDILSCSEDHILLHDKPYQNQYNKKEQQRLKVIYDYIDQHYASPIAVDQMASLVNLSKEAFCRYFKKMTRLTFIEFLNHYRVNQAKRLLRLDLNITEVCYQCGYESLSYFNRTFKKYTQESPSTFRKKFRD